MADKKKKSPTVSVIIPAYNEEQYIAETIESILGQSFTDFELIIVDDGSTDSTYEIASSFTDPRIQVYKQKNAGPANARNKALQIAKGKYIALQDADDRSKPHRLKKQVNYLNNRTEYIGVGTNANILEIDGSFVYKHIQPTWVPEQWSWNRPPVIHASIMFRRSVLKNIKGYPDIPISQDTLFLYEMSEIGKLANLQDSLYEYRINPDAISRKSDEMKRIVDELLQFYIKTGELDSQKIAKINELKKKQTDDNKLYQYHLLLAKKYLWNNYQPVKSRNNIYRSFDYGSGKELAYPVFLFIISFLGEKLIKSLYHLFRKYK